MKRAAIVAALALLASCNGKSPEVREAEQAEAELKVIEASNPSPDEKCRAHRKVADAWLRALNQDKYDLAKSLANIYCLRADQIRLYGT